jgi:hypothetical protein
MMLASLLISRRGVRSLGCLSINLGFREKGDAREMEGGITVSCVIFSREINISVISSPDGIRSKQEHLILHYTHHLAYFVVHVSCISHRSYVIELSWPKRGDLHLPSSNLIIHTLHSILFIIIIRPRERTDLPTPHPQPS